MSLFSYGPIKVLLYLVSKDHSCGLVYGCIPRLWEAVGCVCVNFVYNTVYYTNLYRKIMCFFCVWGTKTNITIPV